ncbi:hypothetical protein [Geoglobus acetivorans]
MICPHCGEFTENLLWRAVRRYRDNLHAVNIMNIDGIIEIGENFVLLYEEKHSSIHRMKTFQAISLKKLGDLLGIPVIVAFHDDFEDSVTVYQLPQGRLPPTSTLSFENRTPTFSGGVSEFGSWLYQNYISHAPLTRPLRRSISWWR